MTPLTLEDPMHRQTPKDVKPIDSDSMGYDPREHEHGQSLPAGHPQRRGPVEFSLARRRAALETLNRESRLARARRVAGTVRRVLLWAGFVVLVAASVAILADWYR